MMKRSFRSLLAAVASLLALTAHSLAASSEEHLVDLQIEEVALALKYRAANPKLQELKAEIETLKSSPGIFNEQYYAALRTAGDKLQTDRGELAKKYLPASSQMIAVEAQIAFVQDALKTAPPPAASPTASPE